MPNDALVATRGSLSPTAAPIAVVVMAINGDARVAAAVASVRRQAGPTEIVVVNTGRGSVKPWLTDDLPYLTLVEGGPLRLPGGTRNLGIQNCTAPIIAFLAADCLATPDWVARRLASHRSGAAAVASALRPAPGSRGTISTAAWATYALVHVRRTPESSDVDATRYGASYARDLFVKNGGFREDVRTGEDTEFNARLSPIAKPVWAPEVLTLHHYPETLGEAMRSMADRGSNLWRWNQARSARPLWESLRRVIGNLRFALQFVPRAKPDVRPHLRRAVPMIVALSIAYGAGVIGTALASFGRRR